MGSPGVTLVSGHLTPAEKLRRRTLGLCAYCGESGHQADVCTKPPKNKLWPLLLNL